MSALWVKRRHVRRNRSCVLYPRKRTWALHSSWLRGVTCLSRLAHFTSDVFSWTMVQLKNLQHVMTGHACDEQGDADKQRNEPAACLRIHDLDPLIISKRSGNHGL